MKNIHTSKIKKYISKNIKKDMSLNDLSSYIGCSSNHTIRIFKKEFDMTPHAFIIHQKITQARKIMKRRSSRTTLASIAKEVGFYDQSHFSKSFKKVLGVNPSVYRRSNNSSKV